MGSEYCESKRKEAYGTRKQAGLALRVALEKLPPARLQLIGELLERILEHRDTLKNCDFLYAQNENSGIKECKKCIWAENNPGYDLAFWLDATVLHVCYKQYENE